MILIEKKNINDFNKFKITNIILSKYKLIIVIFLISTIILCTLLFVYIYLYNKNCIKASNAYTSSLNLLKYEKLKKKNKKLIANNIINEMKKIKKDFSCSKIVELSLLQNGFFLKKERNFKESIKNYNSFILICNKNSKLRPLALIALAYTYNYNKNHEQALLIFENIIDNKFKIIHDVVLWESARLALILGKQKLAKARLSQLKKEYPNSNLISNLNKISYNICKQ